jgi:hypothetical protein
MSFLGAECYIVGVCAASAKMYLLSIAVRTLLTLFPCSDFVCYLNAKGETQWEVYGLF